MLNFMGQPGNAEVRRSREHRETLLTTSEQLENVPVWSLREELFGTGHDAALKLELWDEALELNAAAVAWIREAGLGKISPHWFRRTLL